MPPIAAALLSIMMLAVFALASGAAYLLWKRRPAKQPVLMLLCAAVLLVNVLIWTLPG